MRLVLRDVKMARLYFRAVMYSCKLFTVIIHITALQAAVVSAYMLPVIGNLKNASILLYNCNLQT